MSILTKSREGQEFKINTDSHVLILELREKFHNAGRLFNWQSKYGMQAFGINQSIMKTVIDNKLKLLIHYHTRQLQTVYWINFDVLRNFIEDNNNLYVISNLKKIHNIPCDLFQTKPAFTGVTN